MSDRHTISEAFIAKLPFDDQCANCPATEKCDATPLRYHVSCVEIVREWGRGDETS